MASSRVSSPPVSLKDRIAALEKKNNPNGPQSTSAPSSSAVASAPARSLSPTGGAAPQANVNSLRDKITKFEKKGGTPVPRGSFGMGAPPPPVAGDTQRKGELYGNRVPGLDRPSHAPVSGAGRSVTAPLRPQMTGGDILGLRPQMTGVDLPTLRPQMTGDGHYQRRAASFAAGTTEVEPAPSYAPFVAPTSLPTEPADSPLAETTLVHITPESTGQDSSAQITSDIPKEPATPDVYTDSTSSTSHRFVHSERNGEDSGKPVPKVDEGDSAVTSTAKEPTLPKVELTKPAEGTGTGAGPSDTEARIKTQSSAETLRESITPAPATFSVPSSLSGANANASASPTESDNADDADNSGANISFDANDVTIVLEPPTLVSPSASQPAVAPAIDAPFQSQLRPQPPAAQISPRPATQYDAPSTTPYVEPEFSVPKPAATKSKFTAVVHRRTVQSTPRPVTTYETTSTPATVTPAPAQPEGASTLAPQVPVQTVGGGEFLFSTEELGSLLADAAMLEERLNFSPFTSPHQESFAAPSLASTLGVTKDTGGKHNRSGSQMTIKAVPAQEPILGGAVPASAPIRSQRTDAGLMPPPATAPIRTFAPQPPNVVVAEPDSVSTPSIGEFADFSFGELSVPIDLDVVPRTSVQIDNEGVPPTPPPKSPPTSYMSSLRSLTSTSNAARRMSSLLPGDARPSVSSWEDVGAGAADTDANSTRSPPRHSRSYTHLRDDGASTHSGATSHRDDASFVSHESGRSKWSFGASPKKKGISRATTFAERIWPGSRNRNRTPSSGNTDNVPDIPEASPTPRLPPTPTTSDTSGGRPVSWLSETSSLSSPGVDGRIVDQFPSVPGGTPLQPLDTGVKPRYGQDGTLLTPPDRGSSLGRMFSSARHR